MKIVLNSGEVLKSISKFLLSFQLMLFFAVQAIAQEGDGSGKLDVNVDVNKGNDAVWYNNWWIWAIIVMVFIVVIVAITNRGKKSS